MTCDLRGGGGWADAGDSWILVFWQRKQKSISQSAGYLDSLWLGKVTVTPLVSQRRGPCSHHTIQRVPLMRKPLYLILCAWKLLTSGRVGDAEANSPLIPLWSEQVEVNKPED